MISPADVRGKIDFGIITIRPDEYTAMLNHLPGYDYIHLRRIYEFAQMETAAGGKCGVAVARCLEQGNGDSFTVAVDMIEDLDPCWLVLVGIAGGYPDDDYGLGDVLLASRIYDFTVSAEILNGEVHDREWSPTGGPIHHEVEKILTAIPGWRERLKGWNTKKKLGMAKPPFEVPADPGHDRLYGSEDHRKSVHKSLVRHFPPGKKSRPPLYTVAAVASGNTLAKDPALAAEWRRCARTSRFIEMESAGVYRAANRGGRNIPVLVVRGLSDIIGLKRDDAWTKFACCTAASFAAAIMTAGVCNTARAAPSSVVASANGSHLENNDSLEAGMSQVTFDELRVVTKHLARTSAEAGVNFKLVDPDQKLARNGLTDATRELLVLGLSKVRMVEEYVGSVAKFSPHFADDLTGSFLDEYHRLTGLGLKGDELFQQLAQTACSVEPGQPYRAAGLAVLTYLFEKCEVFEK